MVEEQAASSTSNAASPAGRIDVHAHFLPATLRAALASTGPEVFGALVTSRFLTWDIPTALDLMDRQGIAAAMLSMIVPAEAFGDPTNVPAARHHARAINETAAEAIRDYPGRFGGFASLPLPDVDGTLAELDYALGTLGLDGVVLLTNMQGMYLGDQRLDPIFEELNRRRATVFVHPTAPACVECTALGYPTAMLEFVFDTTRAVTHLILSGTLARCPDLRLIISHAGGTLPFLVDRIDGIARRSPTQAGTSVRETLQRLYYDLALSTSPQALASLLQLVSPAQLLYGSDWPAQAEADVVTWLGRLMANPLLTQADLAQIQRQTALNLFPRLQGKAAAN